MKRKTAAFLSGEHRPPACPWTYDVTVTLAAAANPLTRDDDRLANYDRKVDLNDLGNLLDRLDAAAERCIKSQFRPGQ